MLAKVRAVEALDEPNDIVDSCSCAILLFGYTLPTNYDILTCTISLLLAVLDQQKDLPHLAILS